MNIWKCDKWEKIYKNHEICGNIRLVFEDGVDVEIKATCKEFCKWLGKKYIFPVSVTIYFYNVIHIRAKDGDLVYGIFWGPYDMFEEPYIKISVGDYAYEKSRSGQLNASIQYLYNIAHELTHYFQWLNQVELTKIGEERQATRCADIIVRDYICMKNIKKYELLENIENKVCEHNISDDEFRSLYEFSLDEDPNIRGTVAQILVNSEDEKSEEILVRLASDSDSAIRAEACYSLGISRSITTYEMLKNIACKDRNSTVRGYAVLSLGDIAVKLDKQNEIIQFMEQRLVNEKVEFAKIDIYIALYNLGVEKYLGNIFSSLRTKNYQNRYMIIDYLCSIIDDENKEMILQELLEHRKSENSKTIISLIDEVVKK